MRTTLRHIDIGSAFRVGAILYGLLFLVFGLLWFGLYSVILRGLTSLPSSSYSYSGGSVNPNALLGAGIVGLLCAYGVGVVVGAIFGGIQCAILAFFYNLTARWVGGLKLDLQTEDTGLPDDIERDMGSRRRSDLQPPPTV